jgi:hypothetical protein
MNVYEIIIYILVLGVVIIAILAEIRDIIILKHPLTFEKLSRQKLQPQLEKLVTVEDICAFVQDYISSTYYLWRFSIFTSFVVSLITILFVKVFYPTIYWKVSILIFVMIFIGLTLCISFLHCHSFNSKMSFFNDCVEKIYSIHQEQIQSQKNTQIIKKDPFAEHNNL